jgi:nicotinate phosphoribosyltransferase
MISALTTDLYQLTMAAGYWRAGLLEPATFELFVRRLPERRAFLVAAGLDDALAYLEQLRFTDEDRAWLRERPQFARVPREFFDEYLHEFRFTGEVWAMAEGTPVFAGEPILRVTAPLPEAQLVETALLAIVGFQTSVAAKAARVVHAAGGRPVIEFGARRAHGVGASMAAARASFVGGCAGTSLVEAARRYGIPTSGTMAHSWVQTFATEADAFHEFGRTFDEFAVYLLDTYDTIRATQTLIESGLQPPMVRLDSGNVEALSRRVRAMLDAAGLGDTKIFATGDLDEDRVAALVAAGAPIDGFGVGTMLSTVADAPALSAVYKLVEVHRHGEPVGVIKLSPDKHTWPGPKQVWRVMREGGADRDVLAGAGEPAIAGAVPLLGRVMRDGRRLQPSPSLEALRDHCRRMVSALPASLRALDAADAFRVDVSAPLEDARRRTTSLLTRER